MSTRITSRTEQVETQPAEVMLAGPEQAEQIAASVNRLHDYSVVFARGRFIRSWEMTQVELSLLVDQSR